MSVLRTAVRVNVPPWSVVAQRVGAYLNANPDTTVYFDTGLWHAYVAQVLADHAIEADELITSCTLVRQVVDDALLGLPDPLADPAVAARRDRLIEEAEYLLDVVAERFPGAMEGDAEQLGAVVRTGLFDAPYLVSNPAARGATVTVVDGGCDAVHPETGDKLDEATRIAMLD